MTPQQLAAFDSAFDNCKAKHKHGWYYSIAEGLKAAAGEINLELNEEELAAVEEMNEKVNLSSLANNYDRDSTLRETYRSAGISQASVDLLIARYGKD